MDTFNTYKLRIEIQDKMLSDFKRFNNKMNYLDMVEFFKCSFLLHSRIATVTEIDMFGSSLHNPLLDNDIFLRPILYEFNKAKVYSVTGINALDFLKLDRGMQETIMATAKKSEMDRDRSIGEELDKLGGN